MHGRRFFFLVDLIWVAAATFTLKCGGGPHSQAARSTDRISSHTEYGPCASRNGCDEAATGANRNASRRTFRVNYTENQGFSIPPTNLSSDTRCGIAPLYCMPPSAPPPSQSIRSWAKLTPPLRRPFRRNIMMFVIVRRECIVREKGQQRPARRRRRQQPTAEQLCVENCNCDLA